MRALEPTLEPGRVYRTKDFARWARNPHALAMRLVRDGELTHLGFGLYHRPKQSPLGALPPMPYELVRAFLGGRPFVFTGTTWWNTLGLGTTQEMVTPLVYNTQRSGLLEVAGYTFHFQRSRFPERPTPEWFAVDMLNNLDLVVDGDPVRLLSALRRKLEDGQQGLQGDAFAAAVQGYATRTTKNLLRSAGLLKKPALYPAREADRIHVA